MQSRPMDSNNQPTKPMTGMLYPQSNHPYPMYPSNTYQGKQQTVQQGVQQQSGVVQQNRQAAIQQNETKTQKTPSSPNTIIAPYIVR